MNSSQSESKLSPLVEPPPKAWRLHHHLKTLSPEQRQELLESLSEGELATLLFDWSGAWARDSQLPPVGDWFTWLILAGRGFGKTRTGAETVRLMVERGEAKRIALVAPTSADARDTMVEGESGILAVCPPWAMPRYEPSKRRVTWPNGARAVLFSAEEAERLRGPQHDLAWGDEPASWTDDATWSNLVMGLRLGRAPRAVVTGTPKPVPLILDLVKDPKTVVTRGSTFENAGNLAAEYLRQIQRLYAGTRLGRQELNAEILLDVKGALFSQVHIDADRVAAAPALERIVISVDPAQTGTAQRDGTRETHNDEHGIIASGRGTDGHGYVLEDHSMRGSPDEWARCAVKAFYVHQAECIVAEVNCGGEMVESTIKTVDPSVPVRTVRAMRGKAKRAEPIAALYEQHKVHHVGHPEKFGKLEKQMRVFTGQNGRRDDRCDALCWGMHELLVGDGFAFV